MAWLPGTSLTVAPVRSAMARWADGGVMWSSVTCRRHVGRERGGELVPVEEQEAVLGRQDRRLRPVGREAGDERVDRLALIGRERRAVHESRDLVMQAP